MKLQHKFKYCIVIAFIYCSTVFGQQAPSYNANFWDNVNFGGGIGLNIGNNFVSGMIAPNAMYRFNNFVSAGVGLNALYSSQRDVFKSTVLGGSVLGFFNPYRELQISTEFEQLYVNKNYDNRTVANVDEKYWYPALFLGLGYSAGNVTFGIRYDVLYNDDRSIHPQAWMPFVRVAF